jgi:carbamoyltransferase
VSVVIGVHDGHNASAALLRDGRIELALQEERLTRVKNQGDAPGRALAAVTKRAGADAVHARVALNGNYVNYQQWSREAILRDYERCSRFSSRLKQPLKKTWVDRAYQRRKAALREEELDAVGVSRERLEPVEHHLAHASAAYYSAASSETSSEKILVLTCDGSGDRASATVSIGEGGRLSRIAEVSEHDSIGRLYAVVTRCLGLAPLEHEYKIMGLAPYARGAHAGLFEGLFEFTKNPMIWRRKRGVPSMYAAYGLVQRLIAGRRFDDVAAELQSFLETMLCRWVQNAVHQTGIRRLACAGGVFMNVKANLALLELDEVDQLYVFPSCGDESNSIGAACHVAANLGDTIHAPGAIYYGDPITDTEAEEALSRARGLRAGYVREIEARVAETVAAGKIVARAKGAVEFGARALGNRSILARADSLEAVRIINGMIKNRDFWMPFAPSVLAERAGEYYRKPKPVPSPYMMFAFHTRPEKRRALAGAQHPGDFTTRPHEVSEGHNPDYYRLLKEYEARTGEGALLNTSFNLHGEPIVYRARDAVDVFLRSGLENMALGNWWVEKA